MCLYVINHTYSFDTTFRFIQSENTTMNSTYFTALADDYDMSRTRGIDATLKAYNLSALLLPTNGVSTHR